MNLWIIFYIPLALLVVAFTSIFLLKKFFNKNEVNIEKFLKYFFTASILIVFTGIFYLTFSQYKVWQSDNLTKLFLPPYRSVNYFLFYSFTRFFASHIISLIFSLLFIFLIKKLNKKYEERFFYPEEIYFGAIAVFLTGYPNFVFYLVLMLILGVILTSLSKIRFSLYYFWLPAAIFVIITSRWLMALPVWQMLKI